jgi:hypothetical protein
MKRLDNLRPGCPTVTNNEYVIRYDVVCTHLHYSTCKKLGIETTENWYSQSVIEHEGITML